MDHALHLIGLLMESRRTSGRLRPGKELLLRPGLQATLTDAAFSAHAHAFTRWHNRQIARHDARFTQISGPHAQ